MLFNFQLYPLEKIALWSPDREWTLGWNELTYGWYWLDVGEEQLFRYSDAIIEEWGRFDFSMEGMPYDDGYLSRLLLLYGMLPAILEPVPAVVREHMMRHGLGEWPRRIERHILGHLLDDDDGEEDDSSEGADENEPLYERHEAATKWLYERNIHSTLYMNWKYPPSLWFWSDETEVHIHWDTSDQFYQPGEETGEDGQTDTEKDAEARPIPVWSVSTLTFSIPRQIFLDELRSLHERFIGEMQQQIENVQNGWPRDDVPVELVEVLQTHERSRYWLEEALAEVENKQPTDWGIVVGVIEEIESSAL